MELIYLITGLLIIIGLILFIIDSLTKEEKIKLNKRKAPTAICFLLPARNESNVIEGLYKSIRNQTYNECDISIVTIVENSNDKTCKIAKKYDSKVIIRKKLWLKTKGYALMEAIEYLQEKDMHYDLYFIMDADNTLDKNYLSNMVKSYMEGYDVATGYRNSKNGNKNLITICSTLTFSLINTMINESKQKKNRPITVSGTGMFITGELIDKWKTYPFRTLTEDYELSVYMALNNIKTFYNKEAIFYDEQPSDMKQSMIQRTRWVKGFFSVRKKHIKQLRNKLENKSVLGEYIGIKPYLFIVCGIFLLIISELIHFIINILNNKLYFKSIIIIFITLVLIYVVLLIITIIMLKKESKQFNLTLGSKIKAILINPLFLMTYVKCLLNSLTNKNIGWKEIKHGK